VERSAWTDERLDDRFDHVDRELSQLRSEVRAEFADLRSLMIRLQATTLIAFLGVITAILARGA